MEWYGARVQNTNMLVCDTCMDDLQEQLRTIVIPPDPVPIKNPRPERYRIDNNPISTIGQLIGNLDQAGGLAAAFDGNTNKPGFMCAQRNLPTTGYTNTIGKFWDLVGPQMLARFSFTAPNDMGFGLASYKLQGSDTPVGYTDIYDGICDGATPGEVVDVTITPTTSYMYHRIAFQGFDSGVVTVAQVKFYSAG